ncbi:glycosyltransferase [Mesorhizobium sp. B2-7-2]|nr:glycosyltransferase [Mesorhizobium sp. B2-7-2]
MKIDQIAPLTESVPPKLYGGTERIVSYLTEELVRRGHDVTLFASGDSRTSAELVACCDVALRFNPKARNPIPYHVMMLEQVRRRADEFDVLLLAFLGRISPEKGPEAAMEIDTRAIGDAPIAYPVACLPQAWSAGSAFMMLQACLGIRIDGWKREINVERPRLPIGIDNIVIRHLTVGEAKVDLNFQRVGDRIVCYLGERHEGLVPLVVRS